jgi:hypothetical protein
VKLSPRVKLALIAGGFALPIVASTLVYVFGHASASANYGELLLPPASVPSTAVPRAGGAELRWGDLAGRWVLVTSDGGACGQPCVDKLVAMRQVRLALGREASRVERVWVVDDGVAPPARLQAEFPGMHVIAPAARSFADRDHIHLVDPHGNVILRWPARPELKRMKGDLDRLLRASQIG